MLILEHKKYLLAYKVILLYKSKHFLIDLVYELLRDRKKIQAGFRFWFVQNFYELDIGFKIKKVIEDSDRYLHFWDTYMKGS